MAKPPKPIARGVYEGDDGRLLTKSMEVRQEAEEVLARQKRL